MSTLWEDAVKLVANYLKCPICLELFVEPVTLACGHTFCRKCMEDHLRAGRRTCPQCRYELPEQTRLKKSVTISNILDLQEAGGREVWNQVVTRTDQYQRGKPTKEALLRRLQFLQQEIKKIEALQAELTSGRQDDSCAGEGSETAGVFSPSWDGVGGNQCAESSLSSLPSEAEANPNGLSDQGQTQEMLPDQEEMSEFPAGPAGVCGVSSSAAARPTACFQAEFVLLSFSLELGHMRLVFVPESRTMQVRSSRVAMTQRVRFEVCQWMADQEFSTGRHFWDMDVSRCSGWAAGVAHPDLGQNQQLGRSSLSWCLEWSSKRLSAWHNSTETPLKWDCPNSIRVLLDMDAGRLSFWSLTDEPQELYFFQVDFRGLVRPVFWLFGLQQRNALTFPVPFN